MLGDREERGIGEEGEVGGRRVEERWVGKRKERWGEGVGEMGKRCLRAYLDDCRVLLHVGHSSNAEVVQLEEMNTGERCSLEGLGDLINIAHTLLGWPSLSPHTPNLPHSCVLVPIAALQSKMGMGKRTAAVHVHVT